MSAKRYNLILLIGMICCVCPHVASAQEAPSVSQSSTTKAKNKETKKHEAKAATQTETKKKPDPSKKEKTQTAAAADKSKKQTSGAERKRASTKQQKNTRFVDRNGDGIQDGMEHRFRRKHRNARSSKNTDDRGRHLRQQRRRGAEASSNKGMRGGVQ